MFLVVVWPSLVAGADRELGGQEPARRRALQLCLHRPGQRQPELADLAGRDRLPGAAQLGEQVRPRGALPAALVLALRLEGQADVAGDGHRGLDADAGKDQDRVALGERVGVERKRRQRDRRQRAGVVDGGILRAAVLGLVAVAVAVRVWLEEGGDRQLACRCTRGCAFRSHRKVAGVGAEYVSGGRGAGYEAGFADVEPEPVARFDRDPGLEDVLRAGERLNAALAHCRGFAHTAAEDLQLLREPY